MDKHIMIITGESNPQNKFRWVVRNLVTNLTSFLAVYITTATLPNHLYENIIRQLQKPDTQVILLCPFYTGNRALVRIPS